MNTTACQKPALFTYYDLMTVKSRFCEARTSARGALYVLRYTKRSIAAIADPVDRHRQLMLLNAIETHARARIRDYREFKIVLADVRTEVCRPVRRQAAQNACKTTETLVA